MSMRVSLGCAMPREARFSPDLNEKAASEDAFEYIEGVSAGLQPKSPERT
jgi:hypothetical protein